jgi:hypothetical protein
VNQPIVDENSNAAFDIVYADAQGEKKAVSGLQVRLIRERRIITGTGLKARAGNHSSIKRIWLKVSRLWILRPMKPVKSASRLSGAPIVWK